MTPEIYKSYQDDIPALQAWLLQKADSVYCEGVVPVYVHLFLHDDGGYSGYDIPQDLEANIYAYVDTMLSSLNYYVGNPVGLNFELFGDINIIRNTLLAEGEDTPGNLFHPLLADYSYTSNALNIYVQGYLPGAASQPTSPSPNNTVSLSYYNFAHPYSNEAVPAHEVAHTMGVLHTHGAPQTFSWNVLTDSTYVDHPYEGTHPRELVIRDTVLGLNFPYPNCDFAGDMVCDTDPDCYIDALCANRWPDSLTNNNPIGNRLCGCIFANGFYVGAYEDYNEHPTNATYGNLMSYHVRNEDTIMLTPGQYERVCYYWETVRSQQYDTSYQVNLKEHVDFYGDTLDLPVLTVMRFRHSGDTVHYSNATTAPDGTFQGVLFDSVLTVDVFSLGHGDSLLYTYDDWKWEVSTLDAVFIQKHVLLLDTLESYAQLAADVNKTGTITTLDVVYTMALILGNISEFPNWDDPWVYVPEYIPHDYSDGFVDDPFNMTIDGISYTDEAPYLNHPQWEYEIVNGFNGYSGFDGVKLGNVNKSYAMVTEPDSCEQLASLAQPPVLLQADKVYEFVFSVDAQNDLLAFQLGLHLSSADLEYVAAKSGTVSSFTVEDNMGLEHLNEDVLRVAWIQPDVVPESFANNKVLFKLYLKPTHALSSLDTLLYLDPQILPALFYMESGCTEALSIQLQVNEAVDYHDAGEIQSTGQDASLRKLLLYPNPFHDEIRVLTNWDVAEEVNISVLDMNGHLMWTGKRFLSSGTDEFVLSQVNSLPQGVYTVLLHSPSGRIEVAKIVKQ